ncbi:MAG: 50S ribosomal protein L15 [Alphaproteobacteria bacterium GM202ARS2]|nr:50S ribosomal protein L15 [Alphaproteobacteria bacterium GM202ARS2]
MKLNQLRDNRGAHVAATRVGRGSGSGKGKTCGRGVKGQKSRKGVAINGFEGGQMPLFMRLPKRGFRNPRAKRYNELTVARLTHAIKKGALKADTTINENMLIKSGIIKRLYDGVRLIGGGAIDTPLSLDITSASSQVVKAIEVAGGKVSVRVASEKKKARPQQKKTAEKTDTQETDKETGTTAEKPPEKTLEAEASGASESGGAEDAPTPSDPSSDASTEKPSGDNQS